jgi:hypothetical protein
MGLYLENQKKDLVRILSPKAEIPHIPSRTVRESTNEQRRVKSEAK